MSLAGVNSRRDSRGFSLWFANFSIDNRFQIIPYLEGSCEVDGGSPRLPMFLINEFYVRDCKTVEDCSAVLVELQKSIQRCYTTLGSGDSK